MKRVSIIFCFNIVLFFSSIGIFADECKCILPKLSCATARSTRCIIRASDFNYNPAIGNAAYVINKPGVYYLEDYINIVPEIDNLTLIYINSNNVKLDLNSFVISQSGNHNFNVAVVEVASNLSNIIIVNGVLQNVNGIGIKVNPGVSNLYLSDLVIDKFSNVGMHLNTVNNSIISKIVVTNCDGSNINATDGSLGIKLQNSSSVKVSNCYFNSNISSNVNKDGAGFIADGCNNIKLEKCSASQNSGKNGYGFVFRNSSSSCKLNNCSAISNQSNNGRAVGFLFNNSYSNSLNECISESQKSVGGECAGFIFEGQLGYYFSADIKSYTVIDCIAKNNKSLSLASDAFGFKGDLLNFSTLTSCKAMSNSSANGNVYGFYINNSKYNFFNDCVSSGQDASVSEKNAYGFYSTNGFGNNFKLCKAYDNISGSLNSSISCGFAFLRGEKNSSISECNSTTNFSIAGEVYGIMLGHDEDTNSHENNIVYKNYIANNKGGLKQYGYRDFAAVTTTNLSGNISFGHGNINPSPISQLVLKNDMNYMFILPVNKFPAGVVIENSLVEVTSININQFGNLSVY